jgi:hypothetical protein
MFLSFKVDLENGEKAVALECIESGTTHHREVRPRLQRDGCSALRAEARSDQERALQVASALGFRLITAGALPAPQPARGEV